MTSGGSPDGSASAASSASVAKPVVPRSSSVVGDDGSVRLTPLPRPRAQASRGVMTASGEAKGARSAEGGVGSGAGEPDNAGDGDAKSMPSSALAPALHGLGKSLAQSDHTQANSGKRFTPRPPAHARWTTPGRRTDALGAPGAGAGPLSPRLASVRNVLAATRTPKSARESARSSSRLGVASPRMRAHSRLGGTGGTLRSTRARSVMAGRATSPESWLFDRPGSVARGNTDVYKKRLGTLETRRGRACLGHVPTVCRFPNDNVTPQVRFLGQAPGFGSSSSSRQPEAQTRAMQLHCRRSPSSSKCRY